jgi:hypothetical protein
MIVRDIARNLLAEIERNEWRNYRWRSSGGRLYDLSADMF